MLRFRSPFVSSPAPTQVRHSITYESLPYEPATRLPCTEDAVCVHVDYDRHPLGVHEYEHYIAQAERDERFHVR